MTKRQTFASRAAAGRKTKSRHATGGCEPMQTLEGRRMMSASGGVAYDGSTLELRGPADHGGELRVELDSDASHVRGFVDDQAGEWLRVKGVRKISVVGGEDRDTVQVDARLANTKIKVTTTGIERLKAVPVLLSPRVRMAQWAQLEAAEFGQRLASRLHVKYAGLAELTQAKSITHASRKSVPTPTITSLQATAPAAEPQAGEAEPAADPAAEPAEAAAEQQSQQSQQPAADPADPTAPAARITAMALEIPAGQAVHLDALATELRHGEWNDASFEWDFGDDGSDFNRLRGFVGSHYYKDAGSYDVTLKVTDETGLVGRATVRVTVTPSIRTKIYVSATGSDANDGANSGRAVKSVARALELLDAAGDHAELAFQRGQVHDVPQSIRVRHDDVVLRAYGTGDRAVLRWTGAPGPNERMVFNDLGTRLLTVRGLNFQTTGPSGTGKDRATAFGPLGNETVFLDNSVGNVTNAVLLNARPKGALVQGNESLKATGLRAYFVWGEGENITILGNTVANSTREHVIRLSGDVGAKGVTVAGNDFTNLDRRDSGDRYDFDKSVLTMQHGSFGYVTDNRLHGPAGLGPLGDGDGLGSKDFRWDWAIWENNTFDVRELTVVHGTNHADIRFNVFDFDGRTSLHVEGYAADYGRTNSDITIHGNVAVNGAGHGRFLAVEAGATGVEVTDNAYVAPRFRGGDNNAAGMWVGAGDLGGFTRISGNTWPRSEMPDNWTGGGINFMAGRGGDADWYDAGEWNGLKKVWGEVAANLDADRVTAAVLNQYGVPVAAAA